MLQNVRDNMKGTLVATVVILFFVVPLVLTGVGNSFLGSVAGTDAARVDGESISKADLQRAVFMQKQRLLAQEGVDPTADYLQDDNLAGPVLQQMTQRTALLVAARKGGMAVASSALDQQIRQQEQFHKDGTFDAQTFRRALSNVGFTPTTYKDVLAEETVIAQLSGGLSLSGFTTEAELNALVALLQQKRSFFAMTIPKSMVEGNVSVSDEDVAAYYEANPQRYMAEEKLSVSYLELSVDELAKNIAVDDDQIQAQYQAELANADNSATIEIAHILVEDKPEREALVAEISEKLAAGEAFDVLAVQYSDDSGTNEQGGNLGVMIPGAFPEVFEQAVADLAVGQVSAPVRSDAGLHFIKVLSKTVPTPPSYDDRAPAIAEQLKKAEAEQLFAERVEQLGEQTFGSGPLSEAGVVLGLEVKTSELFSRTAGTGVAANQAFRELAYSEEVLDEDYNSKVLEIGEGRAVVVRKLEHVPAHRMALDEVKDEVRLTLFNQRLQERLDERSKRAVESLYTGTDAEAMAAANGYTFAAFTQIKRGAAEVDTVVSRKAFAMALGEVSRFDRTVDREGNHVVVGLLEVLPGTLAEMPDVQRRGLRAQLAIQGADFEVETYQAKVIADADIEIY